MASNRWVIPLVLAVTVFVHYLDRNNLAIVLPQIAQEFGWSDQQTGQYGQYLLGAFYLTFGVAQILLSPLAERFGVKRSLMLSIVGFSVCTMLFYPLGSSLGVLIALRLLLGAAESVHMPMNSALVSRWFPPHERGRANSLYVVGILVALAVAPLLTVPLAERLGWRMAFLLLGFAGLAVSLPLVARFVSDTPPYGLDSAAQAKLSHHIDGTVRRTHGLLWLYIAAGACNAFCVFGVLNWLPSYLNRTRGIEFGDLSLPLFSVFLAGIVGVLLWAILGDRTGKRIPMASMGLLLASVCVLLTAHASSNPLAIALLALGVFFQSSYNAQEFATLQQMAPPDRVGATTGLYNGATVLVGGVGGSLIPGGIVALTGDFQMGLLSVAVGALMVSLLMALLATRLHRLPQQVQ
ncbi:MAG: MFS transporter [Fimbriimonadales bacterium]|nr:MAG: MFS transporter [Fimbriimonadales bacterium]